jgi:hypothetical protein
MSLFLDSNYRIQFTRNSQSLEYSTGLFKNYVADFHIGKTVLEDKKSVLDMQ